jgi:hypothetical protein
METFAYVCPSAKERGHTTIWHLFVGEGALAIATQRSIARDILDLAGQLPEHDPLLLSCTG